MPLYRYIGMYGIPQDGYLGWVQDGVPRKGRVHVELRRNYRSLACLATPDIPQIGGMGTPSGTPNRGIPGGPGIPPKGGYGYI